MANKKKAGAPRRSHIAPIAESLKALSKVSTEFVSPIDYVDEVPRDAAATCTAHIATASINKKGLSTGFHVGLH